MREKAKKGEAMIEALGERVGRELSTQSILLHQSIAQRLGLSGVDHKYLDIIVRLSAKGAPTPSEIAQASGLTTGGVTGVLNRLEKAGFIRRVAHPSDRRQLVIQAVPEKLMEISEVFAPMRILWAELCADYSQEELELILGFLGRAIQLMTEENFRAREKAKK